jgi:phosphoglycerate dehydrogenase-like enzyme
MLRTLWLGVALAGLAAAQSTKIVVSDRFVGMIPQLQTSFPNVKFVAASTPADVVREIADADAVFGSMNPAVFKAQKKLRWVQIYSAGAETYLFSDFVNSPITLTNCKIVQGPNIADHALALLLALTRKLYVTIPKQAGQEWLRGDMQGQLVELTGKTAVIIGLGGIGTQIAQRAHAFGMRVIGVDPKDIPITNAVEKTVTPDRLHEVLPQGDVVFMSAPHTRETEGMLGPAEFGMMKKNSYFVAVSRGKTYNTEALMKALDEKRLAGAGLDVTNPEPLPQGHPLWKFTNVVITPHVAGQSDVVTGRRLALVTENTRRFLAGKVLLNIVDKQKGY